MTVPADDGRRTVDIGLPPPKVPGYPMVRTCPFEPAAELGHLQRTSPVSRVRLWNGSAPWLITRHEDARRILATSRISTNPELPGFPHFGAGSVAEQGRVRTFLDMDDPEHAAHRRVLAPDFTVGRTEQRRPLVQHIADELVSAMLAGPRPADLVTAVALPLPSRMICSVLGVPDADHRLFEKISNTLIATDAPPEEALAATETSLAYLGDLFDRRAREPEQGLISRLAVDELRAGRMTRDELASQAHALLVAGHESTANMIALGTAFLLENPGHADAVRHADDAQLANAVEELLRFLSVVQSGRRRVALTDIPINGALINAGDGVIVATDIANRDETAFPQPDKVDFGRRTRHHLAFGHGIHTCIGHALARLELQVAFRTLLRRVPTLALARTSAELTFKRSGVVYGVEELPVTW